MILVYIHIICLIVFASGLVGSHLLAMGEQNSSSLKRLLQFEKMSLIGIVLMLISGLALLFGSGKGMDFYFHNGSTHAKLTLAVIMLILSSLSFKSASSAIAQNIIRLPKKHLMFQRILLLGLLVIPFLGLSMSRGSF